MIGAPCLRSVGCRRLEVNVTMPGDIIRRQFHRDDLICIGIDTSVLPRDIAPPTHSSGMPRHDAAERCD